MSFLDELLGSRGCNVDGTTSNNPIMQLTDQLLDTFFLPQNQQNQQASGGFEEASLVVRGGQGGPAQARAITQGHAQSNQAQQWQSQVAALQPQGQVNMATMQHQQSLENIWQQSASMNPSSSTMSMQQQQQRMMMEQQFMAQQMFMQQQHQMRQQQFRVEQQAAHMAAGGTGLKESGVQEKSGAQLEKENDVVEKTATDTDMDELQTLLEEAWNAEGIEGSPEEIRQFWEGMLERRERGESIDATWRTLHDHAMKNAWKPKTATTTATSEALHEPVMGTGSRVTAALPLQQYSFQTDNPYISNSAAENVLSSAISSSSSSGDQQNCDDLFDKGMQYYADGHVDEAILAFEGAIQMHPENVDNVTVAGDNVRSDQDTSETSTAVDEIWNMLGTCHAEMDKDADAIFCHQQALDYDPFNLSALLALGTSHVNEMNSEQALECLQGWVKHNPKFHGLEARLKKQYNTDTADDVYADGTLMDEVLQLMLAVARFDPSDVEAQVVLGVLQNVTQDLEAAVGAFQTALQRNPQDFGLLNKIGATLANGENSAEAIQYYAKALKIRPLYARGWLNLGIAYANLGQYDEAVKAYVQALAISPDASHIWDYLESIFTFQRRYDLVSLSQTSRDPLALAEKMQFNISTPLYSKK